MRIMRVIFAIIAAAAAACAPMHSHETADDARQLVAFPEPMRVHTLANMRDHLATLQQINAALSRSDFDAAAMMAETRLGMTSLALHDASHLAAYMPKPMQEMG